MLFIFLLLWRRGLVFLSGFFPSQLEKISDQYFRKHCDAAEPVKLEMQYEAGALLCRRRRRAHPQSSIVLGDRFDTSFQGSYRRLRWKRALSGEVLAGTDPKAGLFASACNINKSKSSDLVANQFNVSARSASVLAPVSA